MKHQLTYALILFSLTTPALAAKHLAFIGGSGDPPGLKTIFDAKIPPVGTYAGASSSQVSVAFDGGHPETESILTKTFNQKVSDFTSVNFENLISKYEADIRAGTMKPGDQLLLIVDSHGAQPMPPLKTHSISIGRGTAVDLNNLQGSETASLDRLTSLSRLAEEKGIKLGIVDLSCHSGASIPLANSKTCVITASGPDSYAYGGDDRRIFSTRLLDNMRPGKNLEDLFLEARGPAVDLGFPMISTPSGLEVHQKLYPVLKKYINFSDVKADKFNKEIQDSVVSGSCNLESSEVERVFELVRNLESVTKEVSFGDFQKAVSDYHAYRKSIQDELKKMGVANLKDTRKVCGIPSLPCNDLTLDLLVSMPSAVRITEYQALADNAPTEQKRREALQWVTYWQNVLAAREEVLRTYPGLERHATFLNTLPEANKKTLELANKVAEESRKVYSALYKKTETSNPCRDFVL